MKEIEQIQESANYLALLLRGHPHLQRWLLDDKNLWRKYPLTELYESLSKSSAAATGYDRLCRVFREFKQQHFLRIGGRDLLGWADFPETTAQLSDLASVAIQVGLNTLASHPEWWLRDGEQSIWDSLYRDLQFTVIGLGKLGGWELNYVSDVDLFFLYAPRKDNLSPSDDTLVILSRFCQFLSRLLSDIVDGDRVFNVDHRLRPHGKDGPLVPSLVSATDYYLQYGRPWERQMLLKACPVAGDRSLARTFLREVRPFVFRRFLDFQALDELRAMRDRIVAETVVPHSSWEQFDVKLGIGGIREVEFLVQSMQLIFGGRHPELDEPNTLQCLNKLRELELLDSQVVEELSHCYVFLRRVEHWIQLDQNRQTHKLPRSPEARKRLVHALGFGGRETDFEEHLMRCCQVVHNHFLALFGTHKEAGSESFYGRPEPLDAPRSERSKAKAFAPEIPPRLLTVLEGYHPSVSETVLDILADYHAEVGADVQERITVRLERYFSQVLRRPGLMKLFGSSNQWLPAFLKGIAASELLADLLFHYPVLVEGIATKGPICPSFQVWNEAALRVLSKAEDYEEGLEWIRRLKNERILQLVLADLEGKIESQALEEELSRIADFVLQQTFDRVRKALGFEGEIPLAVLAMGKLGSMEMSYLSDLDLVFVYEPLPGDASTPIPHPIIRLIQRFMTMLSTPLHEGPGYAVDARLRPTGTYGPLVVTNSSWLDYYCNQADLWEIQALLRLRHVAGSESLGTWIEERAREICYRPRGSDVVWNRICHLRGRMERERTQEEVNLIDIKLGMGGLADLEFLVQGIQLIEGCRFPALQTRSVRTGLHSIVADLEQLQPFSHELLEGYEVLRSLEHRLRLHLNLTSSRISPDVFAGLKAFSLWPPKSWKYNLDAWEGILRIRRQVRKVLRLYCPGL